MAIEIKDTTIAGVTYHVSQLPYFRAQRLFMRLLKLAGPGVSGLLAMAGGPMQMARAMMNSDTETLTPILSSFFDRLDPGECEQVTREILAATTVDWEGKRVMLVDRIDLVIGGDFWSGMTLQGFALGVHFGNFTSAAAAFEAAAAKAKASRSSESTTSTDSTA